MRYRKICLFMFMLVCCVLLANKVSASEMSFSVKAVIPENQIDKSQSYFDLKMQPNQSQDLTVELYNNTEKDLAISVTPNAATTNQNGVVEYNNQTDKRDDSLKISFKDIVTTEELVTVPAKSNKQLTVHLKMPKDVYKGVMLGGLYFTEKVSDKTDKDTKQSQVVNRYAYVIGVQLTESEESVSPELNLNGVKATQINYRNAFTANIQNDKAAIVKELAIDGAIYKKGSNEPIYSESRKGLKMAPNSNFDYVIGLGDKPFKPGKYIFKGTAKSEGKQWQFEKRFEIEGKAAKKLNEDSVSISKDHSWIYLTLGGTVLISLLTLIIILMIKVKTSRSDS